MAAEQHMSGLRVSPAQARKEIQTAIRKGRGLGGGSRRYGSRYMGDAEEVSAKHDKWAVVTRCMLESIFDGGAEAANFDDAWPEVDDEEDGYGNTETLREGIEAQVNYLVALRDALPYYRRSKGTSPSPESGELPDPRKVFVVHGHDEEALAEVEQFLRTAKLEPVVLYKQANKGKTVIEKFEKHAEVGFAVVLLTPDDLAFDRNTPKEVEERARQNVILELGYFLAKLGRARVCALKKGEVETPSDIHGVVWVAMDEKGAWRTQLAREMAEAGLDVRTGGKRR